MRRINDIATRLAEGRRRFETLMQARPGSLDAGPEHLQEVSEFGANPGQLRMMMHVPRTLLPGAPLVVALHGCTQSAASFDRGTGWSDLADRHGFAVLLPQQTAANNPKACFSWFVPDDISRGRGEAASIRQMIATISQRHGLDPRRVYVTGLSAGGAMAAAMLATYPDVFEAGAVVAGLPFGTARNVQEAFESMFSVRPRSAQDWADLVRAASPHRGPWPRLSVWHGTADTTVVSGNARELVKQWTRLHGLPETASREEQIQGHRREVWLAADGAEVVESFTITGMTHGVPLEIAGAEDPHGAAGPYMLDVGIASTATIAAFWGLTSEDGQQSVASVGQTKHIVPRGAPEPVRPNWIFVDDPGPALRQENPSQPRSTAQEAPARNVGAVIHRALRAAGLMR